MGEIPNLNIVDEASISRARELVRGCAEAAAMSHEDVQWLLLAITELAHNQLNHARGGQIACRVIGRGSTTGVEIEASDRGPGIRDFATAIAGLTQGSGLGVGLAGVRRMASELDVDVRLGESTTLTVRKFVHHTRRHPEVAIMGRGLEVPSGDHALVVPHGEAISFAVVDGAGHGVEARKAADLAVEQLSGMLRTDEPIADVLFRLHGALRKTRGAAITIATWQPATGVLVVGGVGNVAARLYSPRGELHGFTPTSGMLGIRWGARPRTHRVQVEARSVLVMFTDGIGTRRDVVPELVGRSAAHIAQVVLAAGAKDQDDALVLVAK